MLADMNHNINKLIITFNNFYVHLHMAAATIIKDKNM